MAIAGVDIGEQLTNVNFAEMITSVACGIADAQWDLDRNSIIMTEMMSGQRMLRDIKTGELLTYEGNKSTDLDQVPAIIDSRVYFGFDIVEGKRVPAKVSMFELGFTPTFYQFLDTIIEIKIEISLNGGTEKALENKGEIKHTVTDTAETTTTREYQHSGWWWSQRGSSSKTDTRQKINVTSTPVDAAHATKYNYSAEGSSLFRTRMVPVPTPPLLDERIRLVMEMEEVWKEQLKSMEGDFENSIGGLWFNGFETCIRLPDAVTLGLNGNSFTVEAMVRIDDFKGRDETILGTDRWGINRGLHLIVRHRRPYMGFCYNDLGGKTMLSAGVWYHIAWRYDKVKREQAIFLNGDLDNSRTGAAPFAGIDPVHIGRWANWSGSYFNGYIDELRIWNTAREDAMIKDNCRKAIDPTGTDAPKFLWRLHDKPVPYDGKIKNLTAASGADGTLIKHEKAIWAQ